VTIKIPQGQHEEDVTAICYGRLEHILVCKLPTDAFLEELSGMTWLLASVTPCNTGGRDAIQELTSYSSQAASVITDVRSIRAVIGRVHSRTEWTIIDRSSAISHAAFAVDDANDSDDDGLI
jgi:hypothetical protein